MAQGTGKRTGKRTGTVRIGISGWRYGPWRGDFYPAGLSQARELEFASRCFPTIEINGSFYSLQHPRSWRQWYESTPRGFLFAVKGGRFITHMKRLRDIERPLANFFASGVLGLREKLGPFLWQFPPNFRYDPERFASFLELLPRDTRAALALARRRDARMHGRSLLSIDANRRLRHAVEIRHESFLTPHFARLLRRQGVGLVVADTAGKWPYVEELTAPFLYLRLHGDKEIYASGYTEAALRRWGKRIEAWARGSQPADARRIDATLAVRHVPRDVYLYFDNDIKVRAPRDALRLMQLLRPTLAGAVLGDPHRECR